MSVKEQVLACLNQQRGSSVSGQELARRLGVTRAAVWKAITALRQEGWPIDSATNRGYRLAGEADVLDAAAVSARLTVPLRVEVLSTTPSTNGALRARGGEPEGLVLVAAAQTEGRGRMGRAFYSPEGTGLYLSVLLHPVLETHQTPLLTAAAAVAAAEAAESLCGRPVQIKWVNDLLLDGKKVCGILTEASMDLEGGGLEYAVLGVGFDVCAPAGGWPPELQAVAGSLLPDAAPPPGARAALAAAFLNRFWPLYQALPSCDFLPDYRARQAALGRTVEVRRPGSVPRQAVALEVDDNCRLVVRYLDGSRETAALNSGELRINLGNL